MGVLEKIAFYQKRGAEVPNQEWARDLAVAKGKKGVKQIAENLWNKDANVASDCLKVLYEVGMLEPKLIAPYAGDFLKLLDSKNNRMVWGSMIGLATIAPLKADEIFAQYAKMVDVIERGSVITRDNGVKTLALVAANSDKAGKKIFPFLLQTLETCRPKEVPQYAESVLPAVHVKNRAAFVNVLDARLVDMPAARAARVRKVIKQVNALE